MTHETIIQIFGWYMTAWGILDAGKYSIQAVKIQKVRTSAGISRVFMLMAIGSDLSKLLYGAIKPDIYVLMSAVLAMVCMLHMWWMIYIYYPYRNRHREYFKRPNMFKFLWNALLPNKVRRHL